jgi:hypothetical protein
MKQPRNESETHFLLKEVSKYVLFNMGYTRLATEVGNMWTLDRKDARRNTIDAVGLKKISKPIPNSGYQYDVKCSMCGIKCTRKSSN